MAGTGTVFAESIAGRVIESALERGRLAHSLVIHGADTETVEGFARELSARLLGLDLSWSQSARTHPDLFTLRPSGKSRQIRIGENSGEPNTMRHFIKQLAQSPLSGERKVGIVYEGERLNANSANAFLKTLEEPPLSTTILLLTSRPYSLLPTIRSRCLQFRIPAGPGIATDPVVSAWLKDFRTWLDSLSRGSSDRSTAARQVMSAYGLAARYSVWLTGAGAAAVDKLRESGSLEGLDDAETEALKTSTAIGVRHRFLATVESATCEIARRDSAHAIPGARSIEALERAAGLMRLNFNDTGALEIFLLSVLRIWSRKD
jgi:DNA polymerase-3 subunit delta'